MEETEGKEEEEDGNEGILEKRKNGKVGWYLVAVMVWVILLHSSFALVYSLM